MVKLPLPKRINWTFQPKESQFLFLGEEASELRKAFPSETDFIQWFERISGSRRLNSSSGSFFQVVSASDPKLFESNPITVTRGLVLQESPLTIAGSTTFESSNNLEAIAAADKSKLIHALSQFDTKAAENVTHALKAPVNRIKGIAQILKSEYRETPEQELLIKYLSQTSERLSVIVDYILQDGPSFDEHVEFQQVVNSALKVAKRINNRPIDFSNTIASFVLKPEDAIMLERVLVELLSFNQPLFANERSIRVSPRDEGTLLVQICHHFPAGKIELEKGKLIENEYIPTSVSDLMMHWEDANLLTSLEQDTWSYNLFLPI